VISLIVLLLRYSLSAQVKRSRPKAVWRPTLKYSKILFQVNQNQLAFLAIYVANLAIGCCPLFWRDSSR
jgi:hypothetical protein